MKHFSSDWTTWQRLCGKARHGALLLMLGGAAPAAFGQSFAPVSTYPAATNGELYAIALGDVSGDGQADIVTVNFGNTTAGVQVGLAGGGFAPVVSYATAPSNAPTPSGGAPQGVALGDVNGDGRLDIVAANTFASNVGVLLGQASGGFAPFSTYSAGANSAPRGVALGDVNGDGRLDIVTANGFLGTVGVLLGQAAGGFAAPSAYATGPNGSSGVSIPYGVALGDVNGDGRLDIVAANRDGNNVGVLLGQAAGGFAAFVNYSTGNSSSPVSVALGDVNGDGRLDIVTANSGGTAGVLLGQAGGGFAAVVGYATGPLGSNPTGIALGDVNGDGRLDLIAANYGTNDVGVLLGQASGFAAVSRFAAGAGSRPTAVAVGDLNGDRRLDIATANYGTSAVGVLLNTGTYTPLATARPAAADVAIYPNPARDGFTVHLPTDFAASQAELLNSLGQVVRRPAVGGATSFRVETNGLAAGLYTLRLQASGAALARRVAVE